MRKVHLNKLYILIFIVLFVLLLLGSCFIINNKNLINNIFETKIEQEETKSLFSYVVYDNQDKQNIKILITVNSENGIEYIKCPNGSTITANGKSNITLDYLAVENENYIFEIKETNKDLVEETITINNETTKETSLGITILNNILGYKEIKFENKIDIADYDKIYYKINENGEWIESTKLSSADYDLVQNGLVAADNTITIYAKIVNSTTNYTVTVKGEKISIDTTQVSKDIQANSLIEAISSSDIKTGKYKVNVSNEQYTLKVYNINQNLEINLDTEFGTEEDVAKSNSYAQNMIVLKVNGDLTINDGGKLTSYASKDGYGGSKGMMIYCSGTITNNGEISMTARGAYAKGQNVYLWRNADGNYEYIPAEGEIGGTGIGSIDDYNKSGNNGISGYSRKTGGGGSGGYANRASAATYSGAGQQGTSYSGGTGRRSCI